MTEDPLVWIDLEMTGLDTARHGIVEIAVLVTDSDLTVVDDGIDIVVHQPRDVLAAMDDFVRTMHTKSGLLEAIEASTTSLDAAGAEVLGYIRGHASTPARAPLCGNSIGVDRRFLDRYLPDVDQYLHYRSIDVSSFKELCRRWYPAVYKGRPDKQGAHRALDDIRESLDEMRYYRAHMLRAPEHDEATPEHPGTDSDGAAG
ncbi:MAG TPA: oligoribonuclease [Acidimicrobiia bacterium]|nr:oligoribonuclease [Acidimicrobiia bacterium]